jgi:hypothetical protein
LGQLEERHAKVLEQLKGSQAMVASQKAKSAEVAEVRTIAEGRCKLYKGKLIDTKAQLEDAKA